MADRIITMRGQLKEKLEAAGSILDWSHVTKQIGKYLVDCCYNQQGRP